VYSRECAATVQERVDQVKLRATDLLTDPGLRVRWIDGEEIRTVDASLRCFVNVNTPADLP
jgi:molybdopterin-guanine dinucleotide biosynthesis protein A